MQRRVLGKSGLSVSAIGLGCMPLSGVYGPADDAESVAVIHHALDRGIDHLDSADMYGWGHNEDLLGRALKGRRAGVVVATKFGQVRNPAGGPNLVNGRPEYVQEGCDASLKRLGVDVIDLYYQHRVDPRVPIEETVANFDTNLTLVHRIETIAAEKRCTPARLVLTWLLAQGPDVVPIPGTRRKTRVDENLRALGVKLDAQDVQRISDAVPVGAAAGTRYPLPLMKAVYL